MDFGFICSSTSDFLRPDPKLDQVVESHDEFSSYLLVIDKATRYDWVFLCESKEPLIEYMIEFLLTHRLKEGGVIWCDQGGELAHLTEFCSIMLKKYYHKVKRTGADSPSRNGGAEQMNDTLVVMVRTLLYGAELEAHYWSSALLHAIYIYNQRVHCATQRTLVKAWHGAKSNLSHLRAFDSLVYAK